MSERKLQIDGQEWTFRVGRGFVVIRDPQRKSHIASAPAILGCSWNDFERGQWKRTSDGMVKPGQIVRYIRSNILNGTS